MLLQNLKSVTSGNSGSKHARQRGSASQYCFVSHSSLPPLYILLPIFLWGVFLNSSTDLRLLFLPKMWLCAYLQLDTHIDFQSCIPPPLVRRQGEIFLLGFEFQSIANVFVIILNHPLRWFYLHPNMISDGWSFNQVDGGGVGRRTEARGAGGILRDASWQKLHARRTSHLTIATAWTTLSQWHPLSWQPHCLAKSFYNGKVGGNQSDF